MGAKPSGPGAPKDLCNDFLQGKCHKTFCKNSHTFAGTVNVNLPRGMDATVVQKGEMVLSACLSDTGLLVANENTTRLFDNLDPINCAGEF